MVARRRKPPFRFVARRALRYALARSTVSVVLAIPLIVLAVHVYRLRHLPLDELVARQPVFLIGASVIGVAALAFRRQILDQVDQRFFREQYNARLVLEQLDGQVRTVRDLRELASLLDRGIALALRPERVSLLVLDPTSGQLIDPTGELRSVDIASRLATLVHGHEEPLEVDLDGEHAPVRQLPEVERHWLVDARAALLVPAFSSDGDLNGLLILGPREDNIGFDKRERRRLTSICVSTGLVIELMRLKERPAPAGTAPVVPAEIIDEVVTEIEKARECLRCGRVFPPAARRCAAGACRQQKLEKSIVPYVLPRKFRFEERIGTGGMAVVYRATDLILGRTVAIKTLPRVSPEAAMRLHREARTAASVSHPGLAAIHGIETWEGMPMLILELLEGGTLADRLYDGPLGVDDILRTGQSVALALDKIHGDGILHRDIKPSNIGYTADGTPKLLDFGIARIAFDLRRDRAISHVTTAVHRIGQLPAWVGEDHTSTDGGAMVGTISYLSPEALDESPPAPSFDLWSLSVVLWEAATGENLFVSRSVVELLEKIRAADVPDVRSKVPTLPVPLVDFFRGALARDPVTRPQTGRELHQRLEEVRTALGN
ncbi:MAG: serine/threonine-protein kinase [Acidobacteriota bacterium]